MAHRARSRSRSPPKESAEGIATLDSKSKAFEALLFDPNRFSYFLDYLSQHNQAHKLLFWFEAEQFRQLPGNPTEMVGRQEAGFEKYFAPDASQSLDLPEEIYQVLRSLHDAGGPCSMMFCIPQAFVYQELKERWFPRFQASSSHISLTDHLRITYPLTLPSLLKEGPLHDCLLQFLSSTSSSGECPSYISMTFSVWQKIHSSVRPLCGAVLKTLEQRGTEGISNTLRHMLAESQGIQQIFHAAAAAEDALAPAKRPSITNQAVSATDEGGQSVATITTAAASATSTPPIPILLIDRETRDVILKRITYLMAHAKHGHVQASSGDSIKYALLGLGDGLLSAQHQAYQELNEKLIPALRKSQTFANFLEDSLARDCPPFQQRIKTLSEMDTLRRNEGIKRPVPSKGAPTLTHLIRLCPSPPSVWRSGEPLSALIENGNGLILADGCEDNDEGREGTSRPTQSRYFQAKGPSHASSIAAPASASTPAPVVHPGPVIASACWPQLVFMFKVEVKESSDLIEMEKGLGETAGLFAPVFVGLHSCITEGGPLASKIVRRFRTHVKQLRHLMIARAVKGDICVGVNPKESDYKKYRARMNTALLEIMEAHLLESLPGFCLPGGMAEMSLTAAKSNHSHNGLMPFIAPTMHHFVVSVPKRASSGSSSHQRHASSTNPKSPVGGSPAGRGRLRKPLPSVVDESTNLIMNGTCLTTWSPSTGVKDDPTGQAKVVYIPSCTCALTFAPLFDTLRMIVLSTHVAGRAPAPDTQHESLAPSLQALPTPTPSPPSSPSNTANGSGAGTVSDDVVINLCMPPPLKPHAEWKLLTKTPVPCIDHPVSPLFQALSTTHVLCVLQALVLGYPVVVTGENRTLLVSACESFLAILFPFSWHYPYIPLMPVSEVFPFWRNKMLEDRDRGDPYSPSRSRNRERDSAAGAPGASTHSSLSASLSVGVGPAGGSNSTTATGRDEKRSSKRSTPYFIGLESKLVKEALGSGSTDMDESTVPLWGVRSRESCIASANQRHGLGDGSLQVSQPNDTTLECVRRILRQALHVDLDNDTVTPGIAGGGGGGHKSLWPKEHVNKLQEHVQLAVFPEFQSFDKFQQTRYDGSSTACSACSTGTAPIPTPEDPSGDEPEVEPHEETGLFDRVLGSSAAGATGATDATGMLHDVKDPELRWVRKQLAKLRETGSSTSSDAVASPEVVVKSYFRSRKDGKIRLAFLQFWQALLGRAKEFVTLVPEHALLRFHTQSFISSIDTAAGAGGEAGALASSTGAGEYFKELLKTRAFAAFISEEVRNDINLLAVQKCYSKRSKELAQEE